MKMTGRKKEAEKEYAGWGGKREGSGRKQIGPPKKKVTFYISDDEKEAVKTFLATLRNGKPAK
jgi:hypothetical protein